MKKLSFLLASSIMIVMAALPANGQYVVTRESTKVVVEDERGGRVVNVSQHSGSRDKVRVQVAGMEIILGQDGRHASRTKIPFRERYRIASPGHIGFLEVGLNMLPSPNYSMYNAPYDYSFLDLDHGRSFQWSFCLTSFSVKLLPHGILALSSGLQMTWNNYVFSNNLTLRKENGMIIPEPIDHSYKKSKMSTFGFQIPVLLEINLPQRVFIAGGVYGGVNLDTRTKMKFPKEKRMNPYIAPFYYGLTLKMGYDSFYVYGNYNLSQFFENNKGPEVYAATIGLGVSF